MKSIILVLLLCGFTSSLIAKEYSSSQQDRLIAKILNLQLSRQISLERSVSALLTRYPEKIDVVVDAALEKNPQRYRSIMLGAMRAEPVLACSVVEVMLDKNVAPAEEIVRIAIEAEPAYAHEIVNIAASKQPQNVKHFVRIAIKTDPVTHNSVLKNTIDSHPESTFDIFLGAIKALPDQVVSLVKDTLMSDPEQSKEVITYAIQESHKNLSREIVESAIAAGIDKKLAIETAINAGAEPLALAEIEK